MITLYHHPRTRSSRFIFLLEELGAPYEIHRIAKLRRPDGTGGVDPENPHPHGKSPALKDGDTLVLESTAIALYLTDKFPQNGLGPVVGDPKRGAYVTWLAYYAGVMEPAWMSAYMKWEIPRGTAGWVKTDEVMEFVNATSKRALTSWARNSAPWIFWSAPPSKCSWARPCWKRRTCWRLMSTASSAGRPMPAPRPRKMAEIVNLSRARKARAKADKSKTAEANRVLHGTPKSAAEPGRGPQGQGGSRPFRSPAGKTGRR